MYWLLDQETQQRVREVVRSLTMELSTLTGNLQVDQLFPYVGRKDRRKAEVIVRELTGDAGVVADPFSGSGIHAYAAKALGRQIWANEWEPYANRISAAPWRLPEAGELAAAFEALQARIKPGLDELYWTRCPCGHDHVLHSLFFDREPLRFVDVAAHERLGEQGETIIFRGKYRCPICKRKEKVFDDEDAAHLKSLDSRPLAPIFEFGLIENSRINLSTNFTVYKALFPHRSMLALTTIWDAIHELDHGPAAIHFLEDVFLSILPQAKFKDYRSKSQDLHVPPVMLRETNLLYIYQEQFKRRWQGMQSYPFAETVAGQLPASPIEMRDFRAFFDSKGVGSVDLVFTDPPWTDGTAYFERAQIYHPWLNYDLKSDQPRLENEMVITDAPSRRNVHDTERWWRDLEDFFDGSYRVLAENRFLALFIRPIPANRWLNNLNRIKLLARRAGFEPLISVDVGSSDPSMRIQQSASYVFSTDVVMLFLRLSPDVRREFLEDNDLDQLAYRAAVTVQEEKREPFFYQEWRSALSHVFREQNLARLDSPREEPRVRMLFERYCDQVAPGQYLPKAQTPFSGQLFDTPALERLFTYVPQIVDELTRGGRTFTYDQFLLGLAEFVENGTRQLINTIETVDIRNVIETYAEPLADRHRFRRRPLPTLPEGITSVLALDPYDFEGFVAHLLKAQGFTSVALLGRAGDRGVDVVGVDPNGQRTVVQCKRYITNNVSAEPIQRLHSFAITRGATRKILVTTSNFTPQAIEEARNTGTELINGTDLETLIARFLPDYFR